MKSMELPDELIPVLRTSFVGLNTLPLDEFKRAHEQMKENLETLHAYTAGEEKPISAKTKKPAKRNLYISLLDGFVATRTGISNHHTSINASRKHAIPVPIDLMDELHLDMNGRPRANERKSDARLRVMNENLEVLKRHFPEECIKARKDTPKFKPNKIKKGVSGRRNKKTLFVSLWSGHVSTRLGLHLHHKTEGIDKELILQIPPELKRLLHTNLPAPSSVASGQYDKAQRLLDENRAVLEEWVPGLMKGLPERRFTIYPENYETLGMYTPSEGHKRKISEKHLVRWISLLDGYVSSKAGIVVYNNNRGDTKKSYMEVPEALLPKLKVHFDLSKHPPQDEIDKDKARNLEIIQQYLTDQEKGRLYEEAEFKFPKESFFNPTLIFSLATVAAGILLAYTANLTPF